MWKHSVTTRLPDLRRALMHNGLTQTDEPPEASVISGGTAGRPGAGGPGNARGQPRRGRSAGSPLGLHRVIEPAGALPQAAWRLDPSPELWPDETRVRVDRLNLDAASFRQLTEAAGGDPDKLRAAVLGIVAERGKMQNPVTGSGGMLTGVVDEAGP